MDKEIKHLNIFWFVYISIALLLLVGAIPISLFIGIDVLNHVTIYTWFLYIGAAMLLIPLCWAFGYYLYRLIRYGGLPD